MGSNLGSYQVMTWLAKRVGGPIVLFLMTTVGGYLTLRGGEAGIKVVFRKIKRKLCLKIKSYEITSYGKDSKGLEFNIGDKILVIESDGDSVLIEIEGNADNPHFVSGLFLKTISDYKN